jgi:hypothetical protein
MRIKLGPKLLPFLEISVTCCWELVAKERGGVLQVVGDLSLSARRDRGRILKRGREIE